MTRAALAAPAMKRSAFISHDGLHRYMRSVAMRALHPEATE